jgi:prevent-host-death family protein
VATRSVSEARQEFAELVTRAGYSGERTILERHGRPVAAIVSADDLALLELIEIELDLDAVRAALADPANATPIPWSKVRGRVLP